MRKKEKSMKDLTKKENEELRRLWGVPRALLSAEQRERERVLSAQQLAYIEWLRQRIEARTAEPSRRRQQLIEAGLHEEVDELMKEVER